MTLESCEVAQGSAEWFEARLGKITASRIADVVTKTRNGYSAARDKYATQVITERISGAPVKMYVTAAMQHGIDTEKEAREFYQEYFGVEVNLVGFVGHPTMGAYAGASPDGLVEPDGLLEIKCPETTTYFDIVHSNTPPEKYVLQCQWQMACTNATWCDLMFYDNRVPPEYCMKVFRIARNDTTIANLESEVEAFNDYVNERIQRVDENLKSITKV